MKWGFLLGRVGHAAAAAAQDLGSGQADPASPSAAGADLAGPTAPATTAVPVWSASDTLWLDSILSTTKTDLRGGQAVVVGLCDLWSRTLPDPQASSGWALRATTHKLMLLSRAQRWEDAQQRAGFTLHLWSTNQQTILCPACDWCGLETGSWCDGCENGQVSGSGLRTTALCTACEGLGILSCRSCAGAGQNAHPSSVFRM